MYNDYPLSLIFMKISIAIYNAQMDEMDRLEKEGKIFVIYPSIAPQGQAFGNR
jgi:predicted patatin/cPLA2 family phospholipase